MFRLIVINRDNVFVPRVVFRVFVVSLAYVGIVFAPFSFRR